MADLPDGLYAKKPHENAPDFIKAKLSIHVDRFMVWLQNQTPKQGYVNLEICEKKDESDYYVKVDDWEPKERRGYEPTQVPADEPIPDPDQDVPF